MIANGFKPVGWVAAVGAAALGCYMLSLRVASERADVASLERRIVATQQQIRSLQTELGTRGRLQQLEQWNEEVLALSAPVSGQYLQSNVQLARFSTSQPQPLDTAAEVRMASAETAPAAPATPAPQHAVADRAAISAPPPIAQPMVQRASLTVTQPAPVPAAARSAPPASRPPVAASTPVTPERRPAATATASRETAPQQVAPRTAPRAPVRIASAEARPATQRSSTSAPARPQAAAPRSRGSSLLDDRTVRELGTAARAEGRGGTRD
ncbi:MAG: hypothetical protein E6G92_01180 [Alphaproteobacteria bacterium]|nr:MAG: hypothetical protein E6G92_01180 [Alphaproteobacteria bacterium]